MFLTQFIILSRIKITIEILGSVLILFPVRKKMVSRLVFF